VIFTVGILNVLEERCALEALWALWAGQKSETFKERVSSDQRLVVGRRKSKRKGEGARKCGIRLGMVGRGLPENVL
jgi:hypothetical protein